LFTLFLLGQAGIPLTSGFIAKLQVFSAAVDRDVYSLAIIGVLAAVVSAFIYLRIVVNMYSGADAHAGHAEGAEAAGGGGVAVVAREVEDRAHGDGPGQLDDVHARRDERPLDLPARLAGDGEGVEQGVPRVAGDPRDERTRHVEHVHLGRPGRMGEGVGDGHVVHDPA